MKCPKCQFDNQKGMNYCGRCGTKLEIRCPICRFLNPPEHLFCGKCGSKFADSVEPTPQDSSIDDQILKIQRYLPEGLVERILKQKDKIEGERKHVTVMFCDMQGFTPLAEKIGTEEVYSLMDRVYEILIHKVHEFDGTVNEMTGDGIMALFGAPIALEDAPQRAVRASYAIHRAITNFNQLSVAAQKIPPLKMRIGIHSGYVVVGTVGNNLRVEFKAVGDTVNLASRMEQMAEPGSTYVTEEVYNLTEGIFRYESIGPKNIKGKAAPVNVYRFIAPSSRRTRFDVSAERGLTPFIARLREIEILLDGFERAKQGRGQAFSIMGEAGTGKSRILYEFRKTVANENITFLEGKCLPYTSGVAYQPVKDILNGNFYIHEDDGNSDIENKVSKGLRELGVEKALTMPYLLEILSTRQLDTSYRALSPDARKGRIFEALRTIVLKGSEIRPIIMAFEDLHWMDKSSEDVLKDLLDNITGSRVFLIFTYRPEFVHTWASRSYHSQITLNKFSNRESLDMVSLLLGKHEVDSQLQDLILEKTEGIPFFIEEFVKSLEGQGIIVKQAGTYRLLKQHHDLMVPSTIHDVIMSKVDSLPDDTRRVLQIASVVGREFSPELIQVVTELSETQLLAHMALLKESELLYERGLYPHSNYLFKHALTQEVIYNGLLLKRRKSLHELIGRTIENLYSQKLEEFNEVLAIHYANSSNRKKAVIYLEAAGDKAARVHSLEEARQHFQKAILFLGRQRNRPQEQLKFIDLTLKWAEVCQYKPNDNVSEHLKKALEAALEIGSEEHQANVLYWTSRFAYMQGDFNIAIPRVKECIATAAKIKNQTLLAISYNLIGRSCLYTYDYQNGLNYLRKGLELIGPDDRPDDMVYSYGVMGLLQGLTGDKRASIHTLEKAITMARKNETLTFEAMIFGYLGTIHFFYGNSEEAVEKCSICTEISARLGNLLPMAWASFFKGAAMLHSGRAQEGLSIMREGLRTLRKTDSVLALRFFYCLYAECLALHGDFDEAEAFVQKGIEIEAYGQKWGEITELRTMAIIEINKPVPNNALLATHIDKSIRLADEKQALPELIANHRCYADLFKEKGDESASAFHLYQAKQLADKIGYEWKE